MRKAVHFLIFVALLFLSMNGYLAADDNAAAKNTGTKIESFLAQKGQLLVKDVYILGKVSGLYSSSGDISAIIAYLPGEKKNSLKGLIIKVNEGQSDQRSYLSYLDIEEIEELSSGIAAMIRLAQEREKPENAYSELIYTTRDNLSFGIYLDEAEEEGFITTGGTEKLTIILEPEKLSEVKKIVDYGFTLLKMK